MLIIIFYPISKFNSPFNNEFNKITVIEKYSIQIRTLWTTTKHRHPVSQIAYIVCTCLQSSITSHFRLTKIEVFPLHPLSVRISRRFLEPLERRYHGSLMEIISRLGKEPSHVPLEFVVSICFFPAFVHAAIRYIRYVAVIVTSAGSNYTRLGLD